MEVEKHEHITKHLNDIATCSNRANRMAALCNLTNTAQKSKRQKTTKIVHWVLLDLWSSSLHSPHDPKSAPYTDCK